MRGKTYSKQINTSVGNKLDNPSEKNALLYVFFCIYYYITRKSVQHPETLYIETLPKYYQAVIIKSSSLHKVCQCVRVVKEMDLKPIVISRAGSNPVADVTFSNRLERMVLMDI